MNFWNRAPSLHRIFQLQILLILAMAFLAILGYYEFANVGAFFFTIILGSMGASISLMKRLNRKNELPHKSDANNHLLDVLMPILYGTILSGVAYLFFMSGILSGDGGSGILTTNLFPNFTKPSSNEAPIIHQFIEIKPYSIQDTGKLLVWCFLAGYSERFVTGILSQLESQTTFSDKTG